MNINYNEYDSVVAEVELDTCIPAGTKGVVLLILDKEKDAYEVEFVDESGSSLAVMSVYGKDIRPMSR